MICYPFAIFVCSFSVSLISTTVLNTFDFEIKFLLLSTVLLLVLLLFPFAAVDIIHEHKLNQCDCNNLVAPSKMFCPHFTMSLCETCHMKMRLQLMYLPEISLMFFL